MPACLLAYAPAPQANKLYHCACPPSQTRAPSPFPPPPPPLLLPTRSLHITCLLRPLPLLPSLPQHNTCLHAKHLMRLCTTPRGGGSDRQGAEAVRRRAAGEGGARGGAARSKVPCAGRGGSKR